MFAFTLMVSAQHNMHMEHDHMPADSMKVDLSKMDKNMDGYVYQCTMCKDQISDEAGKCSKCGMDLKKVSVKDSAMAMEHHSEMKSDKIWNKYCPVRGEEVDPETPTVDYKGKKVGFCCPGCDKKFNKDPEKYLKNLSEDGQEFHKNK